MTPANALTQWARLLLASLADAGVAEVVISPGSRSTPFVVAAVAEPRLRCHEAIDERAAAFFALGQARVTGRPSVLLCTSGTAAAHYYPAVVEAGLAHVPVLVVTADRPFELQDAGAAQTIDQVKLYGDHVRRFYELGGPDPSPPALQGLRRLAQQAVHVSQWPLPGPVHLNVRARKPLEPRPAATEEEKALEVDVDALLARRPTRAPRPVEAPEPAAVAEVAERCRAAERGLVVAGPAPLAAAGYREAVFDLSRRLQYPLLAEATSQLRLTDVPAGVPVCDSFDALLRTPAFADTHRPDVVLRVGASPTSGAWERFSAATDGYRAVVAPHGWQDPNGEADVLLLGEPGLVIEALRDGAGPARDGGAWVEDFRKATRLAWDATNRVLAGDRPGLREGQVVRAVLRALPKRSALMVGNSLPIRTIDTYGRAGSAAAQVLSQRGANGIDGLVAGAAGTATVAAAPVTLLLGDVSLIHDLNSLGIASRTPNPLVIVVVQNQGGRIFEQLPIAELPGVPASVLDHIVTPHEVSFEGAAATFGVRYERATSSEELRGALARAYDHAGAVLVEAVVPPHGAAEDFRLVCQAVEAVLA